MKRIAVFVLLAILCSTTNAQIAVKTNLLNDAFLTPNIGVEVGTAQKQTFQVFYGFNNWKINDRMAKHWVVNPEYRYWFCHKFSGSFVGVHALGGEFNAQKLDLPFGIWNELKDNRYQGWFAGGGLTYGYQWVMSKHWNFEAAIGAGFIHFDYDKYGCQECGGTVEEGKKNYWGITKAALSLLYIF